MDGSKTMSLGRTKVLPLAAAEFPFYCPCQYLIRQTADYTYGRSSWAQTRECGRQLSLKTGDVLRGWGWECCGQAEQSEDCDDLHVVWWVVECGWKCGIV